MHQGHDDCQIENDELQQQDQYYTQENERKSALNSQPSGDTSPLAGQSPGQDPVIIGPAAASEPGHKSLAASDNITSGRAQEISISDLLVHQPIALSSDEQQHHYQVNNENTSSECQFGAHNADIGAPPNHQ